MKVGSDKFDSGLAFIEMLATMAVLAILISIVVGVSRYVDKIGQISLTEEGVGIVVAALEEYEDYYGKFPFEADANYAEPNLMDDIDANSIARPNRKDPYASSEALYYFLYKTPVSRKVIGSLSENMITNKDDARQAREITIGNSAISLVRFIDSWGTSLRYTYESGDNFPVIVSAGPDKAIDTRDDIKSTGL